MKSDRRFLSRIVPESLCALVTVLLLTAIWPTHARAGDLGFRYLNGQCTDANGGKGLNPGFLGPCGDLHGASLDFFSLDDTDLSGAVFDGASLQMVTMTNSRFEGTSFLKADLTGADFSGSLIRHTVLASAQLKGVKLAGVTFEGIDLSQADLSGANLAGIKIVNSDLRNTNLSGAVLTRADLSKTQLRGANLSSADLREAVLDMCEVSSADFTNADLSHASLLKLTGVAPTLTRTALVGANLQDAHLSKAGLRGAQFQSALLQRADLEQSDVRGADFTDAKTEKTIWTGVLYGRGTKLPFTNDQATKLKMIFQKGANLLILVDAIGDQNTADLKKFLEDAGAAVTLSAAVGGGTFTANSISGYSAVLHLNGRPIYQTDMPEGSQDALVTFVKNGGTFVYTELDSYAQSRLGFFKKMNDLILSTYTGNTSNSLTYSVVGGQAKHPVLENVAKTLKITALNVIGRAKTYPDDSDGTKVTQPAVLMSASDSSGDLAFARTFGRGRVVGFGFTGNFDTSCLGDPGVRQLISNAINWEK